MKGSQNGGTNYSKDFNSIRNSGVNERIIQLDSNGEGKRGSKAIENAVVLNEAIAQVIDMIFE